MRSKKILIAFVSLLILLTIPLGSLYVSAETINFDSLSGDYDTSAVFFYDESHFITDDYFVYFTDKLEEIAGSYKLNIGVYIGYDDRTAADSEKLIEQGTEMMQEQKQYDCSVFLYYEPGKNNIESIHLGIREVDSVNSKNYNVNTIISNMWKTMSKYDTNFESQFADEPDWDDEISALITVFDEELSSAFGTTDQNSSKGNAEEYQEGSVYLKDEAGIFTKSQHKQVIQLLASTSDDIGFNLGFYIGGVSRSDSAVEYLAKTEAHRLFDKQTYNGTVFCYVDFDGKPNAYDYMFCANDAFLYYTNGDDNTEDRIDNILAAMERYFPSGGGDVYPDEILKGIEEYCSRLRIYKQKGLVGNIYYTDTETGEYVYAFNGHIIHSNLRPYRHWFWILLLGLAIAVFAVLWIYHGVKNHYKFKNSASASVYTSKNKIRMKEKSDAFIGRNVTKIKIQTSSGGHSGGGGGGGHHGGGGGGRHR